MYSRSATNAGISPTDRISLPPMNSTHSLPPPPPPPSIPSPFQREEEYSKKATTPYYPYKLPALHESSSSKYPYASMSSSSSSSSFSYNYTQQQQQQQRHQTYSVEHTTSPSLPIVSSSTISSSYSQHHFSPPQPPSQLSPSFSRPSTSTASSYRKQETYYPIYKRQEPASTVAIKTGEEVEGEEEYIEEGYKLNYKRETTERMKEIDREFTENKEVLYREKLKQLQEELSAVEQGQYKEFNESIADLEEKRKEMIQNAKLIMIYQISNVEHLYKLNYQLVEEESLAEQKELEDAMYSIIEEKRKRLKEYKDGELDTLSSGYQTRTKRLLRKRGESETPLSKIAKRKPDRSKENLGHLINALDIRDEQDIEADFEAMMANIAKLNKKQNK